LTTNTAIAQYKKVLLRLRTGAIRARFDLLAIKSPT